MVNVCGFRLLACRKREWENGDDLGHCIPGPRRSEFIPASFAQMAVVDANGFDRAHYDFKFIRREFLGEVRCLLFDVSPQGKNRQWPLHRPHLG